MFATSSPSKRQLGGFGGPRGLLRVYVLQKLSKEPMSGYDLISDLNFITDGTWRPGSGSIYPLLEDLKRAKLIEVVSKGRRSKQVYGLTEAGKMTLNLDKERMSHFAAKWNRIRMAVLDMLTPETVAMLAIETQRMNRYLMGKAVESKEIPRQEMNLKMKEYQLLLEQDLHWVRGQLKGKGRSSP
jgi:DNA-binding PadR family transcriptional regulator